MLREPALSTGEATSSASEVWPFVQTFLERMEDGLSPDLESYLMAEVPTELREPVYQELDRAMANQDVDDRVLPVTDVAAAHEGVAESLPIWLRSLALLVPGVLRAQMLRALSERRREGAENGVPRWRVTLGTLRELMEGIAQRAPLRPPPARETDHLSRAARGGWISWRLSGPLLLAGYVLSNAWLAALGVIALLSAFGCLVAVTYPDVARISTKETRFMNALLGGAVTALTLILAFGLFCGLLIAAGSLLSWGFLSALAMHLLVIAATTIACGITVSGWAPEEWYPEWLVRV